MLRHLAALVAAAALVASPLAAGQKDAGAPKDPLAPKPDTYICPSALGAKAVDCFLNAVEHLYTMCRQVKSIEIIEFGYERSEEGVNGAKSEYCVDKHRQSMARPLQAALKEAGGSHAVDSMRRLHELWLNALAALKWVPGETDEQYKARVAQPYAVFTEYATTVRVALTQPAAATAAAAAPASGSKAAGSGGAKTKTAAATKSAN